MQLKRTFAAAIVSCASALAVATPSASAGDPGACAFNGRTIFGQREYQCNLWRGNVPVYTSAWTGSSVLGYLYTGGRANWFVAQCVGVTAHLGPYVNYWWARTMADNGRWGFVPLTYFAGGRDNQASGVLPPYDYTGRCGGGSTHPST